MRIRTGHPLGSLSLGRRLVLAAPLVSILASVAFAQVARAQDAPASLPDTASTRAEASDVATPASDYIDQVRANFTPENRRYSGIRTGLGFLAPLYGIAVGLIVLFGGISARIRDFAHARARGRYLRVLIYLTLYSLVAFVLTFPLAVYQGFILEHQFQLSNQSFGEWLGDEAKGLVLGIVFFGLMGIVSLAYLAIEKSPRRWWLWLGLGSIPVVVLVILIQPLVIEPLFNKFQPLRDVQLRDEILALAAKAEIPARKVLEADKSKQTKKYNAYVSGFGASQRIVLWDTTLQGMKKDEILFVMGHEMGHYRLGHIWKGIAFFSVLSFGLFFLSGMLMRWATARWGARWGFHELHDIASLPLLVLTLSVVGLVSDPLTNTYTRTIEHEADTFGLEVTRLNDAGARTFIKLGSQNRSNPEPSPIVKLFQYTHPPLIERIRYAMEYRPWERGEPNQAFKPRGGS